MATKKFLLEFSDEKFGCEELGWMSRMEGEDPDDEDMRYRRFLRDKGIKARVCDCCAFVTEET